MMSKLHWAIIASLGAAAPALVTDEVFARSGGAPHGGATVHAPRVPSFGRRGRGAWNLWPGGGAFFYGPAAGEPFVDVAQPLSSDVRYSYTYDVPWDWVHRYPPNVVPSSRPYVPGCPSETVVVPGRGGAQHSVNIMRCY